MKANKKFYSTIGIFTIGGLFIWSINDPKVMSYFDKKEETDENTLNDAANRVTTSLNDANRSVSYMSEPPNQAVPVKADFENTEQAQVPSPDNQGPAPASTPAPTPASDNQDSISEYPPSPAYPPASDNQSPAPAYPPAPDNQTSAPAYPPATAYPPVPAYPPATDNQTSAPAYPSTYAAKGGTRRQATANKTRRCKHCNHEYHE